MIAVLVNPRSRANRRNPRVASEFQAMLGDAGRVLAPKTLDELDDVAAELRRAGPRVIAVHGGDGTLHRAVTALGRAYGADPIPPIAVLCGGTMNVVATSLRIRARPMAFLTSIIDVTRAGGSLDTVRRHCLRIDDKLGFIFGNGLMANFLGEYYNADSYGPARAAWLLLRTVASIFVHGTFVRKIFRRFEGTVSVDGQTLQLNRFVSVGAATVREVGLGFKLIHRADDDPERFGVLAIHAPPLALVPDLWSVHAGRGIAPRRAFSAVASRVEITPRDGHMAYTVDGDLYRGEGTLSISIGPALTLVRPMTATATAAATTAALAAPR